MGRLENIKEVQLRDGSYLFCIGVGDTTCDGHDERVEYIVNSNVSVKQIALAGRRIIEVTGINLEEDIFREHKDHYLTQEQLESLAPFGIYREDLIPFTHGDEYDLTFYNPKVIVHIFCRLIEYVDPTIQLQILHLPYMNGLLHENPSYTYILGYGLFDF